MAELDEIIDLGQLSDVKALRAIFNPDGLQLVDVGCGDGDLARKLAFVGAQVLGVEPDSIQAQKNARAEPVSNVTFAEAVAAEMPVDDTSVDGVIFSLSLHHVPQAAMRASLEKAHRALKPGGFLAAVEPLAEGSYNAAIELFHDEREVRQQAIDALEKFALPLFDGWRQYHYNTQTRYPGFAAFVDHYVNITHSQFDADIVRSEAVRSRFEAARAGDEYILQQPMRIDFYRSPL